MNTAVAAGKKDIELIDEMEKVLSLSFTIADMFMLKVNNQEKINDNV